MEWRHSTPGSQNLGAKSFSKYSAMINHGVVAKCRRQLKKIVEAESGSVEYQENVQI
jgi:hypothetical protein